MKTFVPPAVRQLEKLLQEKFIPWSQNGAPLVLLDTPPRSALPLDIREEESAPLRASHRVIGYHKAQHWKTEKVNAVEVAIIGCVIEGTVNYRVHSKPGEPGKQWTVPMKQGTMFFIPPDTPFSDGSTPPPDTPYGRALLIYLRRDGVNCHSFTADKGKLWLHPYTFLHEPDALLPGDRLIREMQQLSGPPDAIIYHYLSLILCLMQRCIRRGNFSTLKNPKYPELTDQDAHIPQNLRPEQMVRFVTEYIEQNLIEPNLSLQHLALHVRLSPGHLNRLFNQEKGMTAIAYVQQLRNERAKFMLTTSPLPIARIAGLCGFNDLSIFSHWFSRHNGCSPTTFRQRSMSDVQK